MVQIEIQDGPDAGKTISLATGSHSVGRAATNDVVLAANSVSGKHLQINVDEHDTVVFKDLNSTNGTFSGGMKVVEGEWFAGSELVIGNIGIKLIDDTDSHRRLRDEVLEKKKSSKVAITIAFLVVGGVGAFGYFQYFGTASEVAVDASVANPQRASQAVSYDLIDNLGDFNDSQDWVISKGAIIKDGVLRAADAPAQANLSRAFFLESNSIKLSAKTQGDSFLEITWGEDSNHEQPLAVWRSESLAADSVMSFPPLAKWIKVSVQLSAGAQLSELRIESSDASASSSKMSMATAYFDGGNLAVVANDALAFSLSSTSGKWQVDPSSAKLVGSSKGKVMMQFSNQFLSGDSGLQVLASGGPIVPSASMTIDRPAGLLCGTEIERYYFDFDRASSVTGNLSRLRVDDIEYFSLVWDMTEPLTQAAREMQIINSALNSGDDIALLNACQRLLRSYPLKDENVNRAIILVRETMARGKRELADLQQQASGALFVGASQVMLDLSDAAAALGLRFEGTDIQNQTQALSELLLDVVERDSSYLLEQRNEYYSRVVNAISPVYPQISMWLKEVK